MVSSVLVQKEISSSVLKSIINVFPATLDVVERQMQNKQSQEAKTESSCLSECNEERKQSLKSEALQMARNVFHPFLFHPWNTFYPKRGKQAIARKCEEEKLLRLLNAQNKK